MAAPKKRLGKGSQRLKFKDVSPKAEKEEQEMLDKKMYGGKMKKKPVAMEGGGKASRRQRSADAKISKKMDSDNLPHSKAMKEKKEKAKGLAGMLMGVQKKKYGGKMKKMESGGSLKMVEKNGEKVPFYAADGVGKMGYGGKAKKMKYGGKCRGMGAATRGGDFTRDG